MHKRTGKENEKIIYSINFEDVQEVAKSSFGKVLTKKELKIIEDKIGDYFDWYNSIEAAIFFNLELSTSEREED